MAARTGQPPGSPQPYEGYVRPGTGRPLRRLPPRLRGHGRQEPREYRDQPLLDDRRPLTCSPLSPPTASGTTWPAWSGSNRNAAVVTGSRPTPVASLPASHPKPGGNCRRCTVTGPSKTPTTGSWTWPLTRTIAAFARTMPPTTGPPSGASPTTGCGSLEQGLLVPTDKPQTQAHLDAIALTPCRSCGRSSRR